MKTFGNLFFLWVVFLTSYSRPTPAPQQGGFIVDPSKHYVYLKFDHVGYREPLSAGEAKRGLWLQLVNNCRVPITVAIFNAESKGSQIGVYHDVVPISVNAPIVHLSNLAPGSANTTLVERQKRPPKGYSIPNAFSTTSVAPESSLRFSMPSDHVSPGWGIEIRFYLDLPGEAYGSGPYSVVSFDWQDIPEEFRPPK